MILNMVYSRLQKVGMWAVDDLCCCSFSSRLRGWRSVTFQLDGFCCMSWFHQASYSIYSRIAVCSSRETGPMTLLGNAAVYVRQFRKTKSRVKSQVYVAGAELPSGGGPYINSMYLEYYLQLSSCRPSIIK